MHPRRYQRGGVAGRLVKFGAGSRRVPQSVSHNSKLLVDRVWVVSFSLVRFGWVTFAGPQFVLSRSKLWSRWPGSFGAVGPGTLGPSARGSPSPVLRQGTNSKLLVDRFWVVSFLLVPGTFVPFAGPQFVLPRSKLWSRWPGSFGTVGPGTLNPQPGGVLRQRTVESFETCRTPNRISWAH